MHLMMETTLREVGPVRILYLQGRVFNHEAEVLSALLSELIENMHHQIIINCSELAYITPHGLSILVQAQHRIKFKLPPPADQKRDIVFCNLSEKMLEVLNVSGLVNIFTVYKDEIEALNFFFSEDE